MLRLMQEDKYIEIRGTRISGGIYRYVSVTKLGLFLTTHTLTHAQRRNKPRLAFLLSGAGRYQILILQELIVCSDLVEPLCVLLQCLF